MKKYFVIAAIMCVVFSIWRWRKIQERIEPAIQPPTADSWKQLFPADSRQVFEKSDHMTLYAVGLMPEHGASNTFHDYPIIGRTEITQLKMRRDIVAYLYHGVETYRWASACFKPRHAIRASQGKKTVDLLICFDCSGIQLWYGDKEGNGHTSKMPQSFYDETLVKAGVILAQ